jgi:4-carboxymuconolactone decarboxylase
MTAPDQPESRRQRGMRTMADVYSWGDNLPDLPGEYFAVTAEHLFGDIWNREGLTIRDRRLMLFGVIAALGETAVLPVQLNAALAREELTPDQLREVAIFLTQYVGWPRGAAFHNVVEESIRQHKGSGSQQEFPVPKSKG